MHLIHQVKEGWEVRDGERVKRLFTLKPFETHESCGAVLNAIEYVRRAERQGTYFDFSERFVKNRRAVKIN